MNSLVHNFFYINALIACSLGIWVILGAMPVFDLDGMFSQVDTQVFILHSIGGFLFILKSFEIFFYRDRVKQLNNIFFIIPLCIGLFSAFSALLSENFYLNLLGSTQIGQGAFWYFDLAILTLFFSIILTNRKIKVFLLFNFLILIAVVTKFTLHPYWKGLNVSFFYFNDYLCYFGILAFIYFSSIFTNKYLAFFSYFLLGFYLSSLDNTAAFILWVFVLLAGIFYELFYFLRKHLFFIKIKEFLYSNLLLTFSVLLMSILIILSSLIYWPGDGGIPSDIGSLASLVVRGKIVEVALSGFFNFNNLLFGEGWGRISDLLLAQMNPWQYDQLTVGYNLHFHSHNEFFEHLISLGLPGAALFLIFIYYIFKYSEEVSIYNKLGWMLFFYVSCFWFFWAGTLPLFALALGAIFNFKNNYFDQYFDKIIKKHYIVSLFFILVGVALFYGSWSTLFYTKEYKKITYEALHEFSKDQQLSNIQCENFYSDKKGGETLIPFMNTFPDYLRRNKIEYNEEYLKVIKTIQCLSEKIIFNSEAKVDLISASMLLDINLFFSESDITKGIFDEKENFAKLKNKAFILMEKAPKRGDLIMPFIAVSLKKDRADVVQKICSNKKIEGVSGYCSLVDAYQTLNKEFPSNNDIRNSINSIKEAISKGILEEKVYGWWTQDILMFNAEYNTNQNGIPLSADIMYYISLKESLDLIDLVKKFD